MELLKRDMEHKRDIQAALKSLRESLGRENIPFGLIGALALRYHGYNRFTEDIELLTTKNGLDRIHDALVGRGFLPRASGSRKKLRMTQFKVNLDVVIEGEHAGSNESPTVFPSPESGAFKDYSGLRVANLDTLIELKLASGIWAHRGQGLVDIQKLIQANRLDESFAEKLPAPLRPKYLELLAESRREIDIE